MQEISNVLWSAQGITDKAHSFRAAPSAGATYPLELFVAREDGLFRYIPEGHLLKKESGADLRTDLAEAALNQMFIKDAGIVIIICALFERTTRRYGKRGVRYIHIEAGHCAQNIQIEAVALGLASVPIGAFDDEKIKDIINVFDEEPLYIIPVGYPEK